MSRKLVWLRVRYKVSQTQHLIQLYVKKDLLWWHRFLPFYNGVSMMLTEEWSEPDEIFIQILPYRVVVVSGKKNIFMLSFPKVFWFRTTILPFWKYCHNFGC